MARYKPEGYPSLSPYFMVKDAPAFLDFLESLFGGVELQRYTHADGTIAHAEVRLDDAVIMLSQATDDYPPNHLMMHLYVPDATAVYARALSLGCQGLQEPVHQAGDPDLRGMFQDMEGHTWAVSTQQDER